MGILFVISIAALLALLWAAFQTARHVRRTRRRQRNAVRAVAEARGKVVQRGNQEVTVLSTQGQETGSVPVGSSASTEGTAIARERSQVRYSSTGIIGNSFTGTSPKI